MNKVETKPLVAGKEEKNDLLEGWDTVYAIRYADVNSAIVKAGSSPDTFEESLQDGSDIYSIDGTFSDWALTIGGAGHLVMMTLPVPTVTFKRTGHPDEVRTDVTYTIKVEMMSIPHEPGPGEGMLHKLVLRLPDSDKNAVVTVEDCVYDGSDSDLFVKTWLVSLMGNWLNKHLEDFSHTFATVNVGAKAAVDKFQWMMPTHTSYAVIDDNVSIDTGILGVLCMTEDRAPSPDQIITRETIPEGKRSSFLISKERFLSKMLIPGMGHMFSGPTEEIPDKSWPEGYFELTDNNTAITNVTGLRIDKLNVGDEVTTALADARSMTVKMEETFLETTFEDLRHPYWKALGDYWLNIHHNFSSRSVARLNKDQVFDLIPGSGSSETKVAHHTAFAKKTKFAETIDWVIIFFNIATLLFPLARGAWLRFVAQDIEEVGEGAVQVLDIVAEGAVEEEAAVDMAAEGAEAAQVMEQAGEANIGTWLPAWLVSKRAFAIFAMSATLLTEEILAALADKNADKKLPQYREFAATVMEPVTWPAAAAEYTVEEVQFNGSFQTIGNPNFSF